MHRVAVVYVEAVEQFAWVGVAKALSYTIAQVCFCEVILKTCKHHVYVFVTTLQGAHFPDVACDVVYAETPCGEAKLLHSRGILNHAVGIVSDTATAYPQQRAVVLIMFLCLEVGSLHVLVFKHKVADIVTNFLFAHMKSL